MLCYNLCFSISGVTKSGWERQLKLGGRLLATMVKPVMFLRQKLPGLLPGDVEAAAAGHREKCAPANGGCYPC
jgi:hypothetical protein